MIRPVRPDGTIETGGIFVPIVRRRVIDRIASAAMQRVVLIVAPAGYGKSVALRQYLDTLSEPYLRYDVLPDNTGLLGFLRGLADALAGVAPDARGTLAGAYEKNAAAPSPGTDLALWMHSHLRSYRGVIAIDDLQVAQGDREVTRFLTSLIERTKGRVQWIIASRATTGLPIGTWLAYGESDLAIDEHDLKFSVEEAKEAARTFRLGVRDEELFELLHLTDGWATAMTFALRSSTRSVDLRNISSMTREMVYRYLAEQVYQMLSEEERHFIETAALLPEINLDVMIAAGFDRSAALIADLRARVAFIHEDESGRYRLHDMFKEFVLHQAGLGGRETVRTRLLKLGNILESMQRYAEALRLYVEAASPDDSLRLITSVGLRLLDAGFADEVELAATANYGAEYAADPTVVGLRGLVDFARGRAEEGERKIQRALASIGDPALRGELALRLAVSRMNRRELPIDLLTQFSAMDDVDAGLHIEAQVLLALCHAQSGERATAKALLNDVLAQADLIVSDETTARVQFRIGNTLSALGDDVAAKARLVSAAELASRCGLWSTASRSFRNLSLVALFSESDSSLSLWYAQQAASAATRAGDYGDLQNALLVMLSLETRRGNADRAAQIEKQLLENSFSNAPTSSDYLVSSQAHRHAWTGRFADAHRMFASILDRQAHWPDRALVRACQTLTLALDGQTKESSTAVAAAIGMLDQKSKAPDNYDQVLFDVAEELLLLAEIVAGRHTNVSRLLKRRTPSSNGAVQCLRRIVDELSRAATTPSYLPDIGASLDGLREFGFGGYGRYAQLVAATLEGRHEPDESVALTPSELRVIRDLAAGLSPKQIAAEMARSVYTVQTHIQNVIEKFGCHGRAEAIAHARRSGLLEDRPDQFEDSSNGST